MRKRETVAADETKRKPPQSAAILQAGGRWITARDYSELHSIPVKSLDAWRYRDHLQGRTTAAEGYPVYRRFGRSIRYWVPAA